MCKNHMNVRHGQPTISTILFFSNLKEPSWTVITKFGCIWCSTSSKEDANVSEGHLGKLFDQLHDTILKKGCCIE